MSHRSKKHLSDHFVDRLKAGPRDQKFWDASVPGFGFRLTAMGYRSWIVQFDRNGKKVIATLGNRERLNTEDARKKAAELRDLHDQGVDILAHLKSKDGPKTVVDAVKTWEEHQAPRLKASTVESYKSIHKTCIIPRLGKRLIKDLSLDDVRDFHKALAATPIQANRAVAILSALITMAINEGWRASDNPCHRFRRPTERSKQRTFSVEELERLEAALSALVAERALDAMVADMVRFIAYSGLRSGESLGLTWDAVDEARNTMRFGSHKTDKGGLIPKVLPLNSHLRKILARRRALRSSDYVFPSAITNGRFKGMGKCWERIREKAKLDAVGGETLTLHDLRRSFRTCCGELGYSDSPGDTLLGHSLGKVRGTYLQFRPEGILGMASQATADWMHAAMQGKKPQLAVPVQTRKQARPPKDRS